jgi:hypothetical protein
MDRSEVERRRIAVLRDVRALLSDEAIYIRVIQAGAVLVIATVADKAARPSILTIIERHFPGAVKFEP